MAHERRSSAAGDPDYERRKVNIALAKSKRLIAEIDLLLEHSRELMEKQSVLHRSWRR